MNSNHIADDIRTAAVADYHASGGRDSYEVVAKRNGISRTSLRSWVEAEEEITYSGGWEVIGGISRPLCPSPRSTW